MLHFFFAGWLIVDCSNVRLINRINFLFTAGGKQTFVRYLRVLTRAGGFIESFALGDGEVASNRQFPRLNVEEIHMHNTERKSHAMATVQVYVLVSDLRQLMIDNPAMTYLVPTVIERGEGLPPLHVLVFDRDVAAFAALQGDELRRVGGLSCQGSTLTGSIISAGVMQELQLSVSPKIFVKVYRPSHCLVSLIGGEEEEEEEEEEDEEDEEEA